jgi:hypothetical protein
VAGVAGQRKEHLSTQVRDPRRKHRHPSRLAVIPEGPGSEGSGGSQCHYPVAELGDSGEGGDAVVQGRSHFRANCQTGGTGPATRRVPGQVGEGEGDLHAHCCQDGRVQGGNDPSQRLHWRPGWQEQTAAGDQQAEDAAGGCQSAVYH